MKKTSLLSCFAVAALASAGSIQPAQAENYTLAISTSNYDWNQNQWNPNGIPGEFDTILDIDSTGSTRNFFLNGDRTLVALKKTSTSAIRFYNGFKDNSGGSDTLTLTSLLQVEAGTYLFRGRSLTQTRLTIETPSLILGTADSLTTGGTIQIGGTTENADYTFVTLNVTGTTTLYGRSRLHLDPGPTSDTIVNLGHVSFEKNGGTGAYLQLHPATGTPVSVEVKSLRSEAATSASASIKGGAVLKITGMSDDPLQPSGKNNFGGQVQENIRVEKTGTNIQIFSHSEGNTYAGGTLVSSGTLIIQNTEGSGLGTGSVEISGTGILAGNGRVELGAAATFVVGAGGSIAPGSESSSVQTLTLSGLNNSEILTMQEGSSFTFHLAGSGQNDSIEFLHYGTGGLNLASPEGITLNVTGTVQEGTYQLFTFRGGDEDSTLVSSGLTGGLILGTGFENYHAVFHYDEPGVISMEIAAIPEPGSVALGVIGIAALLYGRRLSARR